MSSTQQWLDATYAGATGRVHVDESGITGWDTIHGLRRGLHASARLTDAIDAGSVDVGVTTDLLRRAANARVLPTAGQSQVCGRGFGRVLARLGA